MKGKSVGIVGIAILTAHFLGIVFLGFVARNLTHDANANFLAIWGFLFAGASVLTLNEQESARQAAIAKEYRRHVPVSAVQLALVSFIILFMCMLGVAILPVGRTVLGSSALVYISVFVAIAGFSVQYLMRGILLGQGKDGLYSVVVAFEAIIRLGLLIAFYLFVGATITTTVVATCSGAFAWVVCAHVFVRDVDYREGRKSIPDILRQFFPLAVGNALLACILTGFPMFVTALIGSSRGLALFFSIVTLSRIPLTLMATIQALIVPAATRALLTGNVKKLSDLQGKLLLGLIVSIPVLMIGGYIFGPWATTVIFGASYRPSPWLVAIMLGMSALLAVALLQVAVFVPLQQYGKIAVVWGMTVLVTMMAILLSHQYDSTTRGTWGFITASVGSYLLSTVLLRFSLKKRTDSAQSEA